MSQRYQAQPYRYARPSYRPSYARGYQNDYRARPRPRPYYAKPVAPRKPRDRKTYIPKKGLRAIQYGLPALGTTVGGLAGGPAGAAAGGALGSIGAGMLSGFGDYSINYNTVLKGETPRVTNSSRPGGGTIITFREYLGDVVSEDAVSFNNVSFDIKPTDERTFPWLSQIAGNYQEWVAHGIVFEFRSMSADALNSVNTSLGQVIMATNYNASLAPFQSKAEAENSEFSKSIKPSESCFHPIECAKSATVLGNLYTNNSNPGDDVRFTTLGKFQIMTNAMQGASVNVGELWVTYSIELLKPKIFDSIGEDVLCLWVTGDGVSTTKPMGENHVLRSSSNFNTIAPNNSNFYFPYSSLTKTYNVNIFWVGDTPGVGVVPALNFFDGATLLEDMYQSGPVMVDEAITGGTTLQNITASFFVVIAEGSVAARLNLGNTGVFPGATSIDIKLTEVPNSFRTTEDTIPFLETQP